MIAEITSLPRRCCKQVHARAPRGAHCSVFLPQFALRLSVVFLLLGDLSGPALSPDRAGDRRSR